MNFADISFWQNFITGLAVVFCARFVLVRFYGDQGGKWDRLLLITLSLYLLSQVNITSFIIFILLAILNYLSLQISHRLSGHGRWLFLFFIIPAHLLPLFYYKYSHFVLSQTLGMHRNFFTGFVIPAGISFYTFQKIALLIDYYRSNEEPPSPVDYLNFSGFFPLTIAGPIERAHALLPQMQQFRFEWVPRRIDEGLSWVVLGMFYKIVLSDNISAFIKPDEYTSAWQIWNCSLLFGLKIYFDFAGYSLMALGIAKGLGITLTLNFKSPYLSASMKEFWNNWHVSLNQWFRDYIYFPLGGNRTRFWFLAILFVFLISGVWHGAGWNYLIWGFILGVFTVLSHFTRWLTGPRFLGWLVTMLVVFFAWTAFYETRTDVLCAKFRILLNPAMYANSDWMNPFHFALSDLLTELLLLSLCLGVFVLEYCSIRYRNSPYALLRHPVVTISLVFLTVLFAPLLSNEFIYFSF